MIFFWIEEMAVVARDRLRTSKFVSFQHQRVHGSLHPLCRPQHPPCSLLHPPRPHVFDLFPVGLRSSVQVYRIVLDDATTYSRRSALPSPLPHAHATSISPTTSLLIPHPPTTTPTHTHFAAHTPASKRDATIGRHDDGHADVFLFHGWELCRRPHRTLAPAARHTRHVHTRQPRRSRRQSIGGDDAAMIHAER